MESSSTFIRVSEPIPELKKNCLMINALINNWKNIAH